MQVSSKVVFGSVLSLILAYSSGFSHGPAYAAADDISAPNDTEPKRSPIESKPDADRGTLEVHYHHFVLLKHDGKIIAIHIMPDPAHGWSGIDYRWYQLTDGSDRFFKPSPDEADNSRNRAVKTGTGETHEVHGNGRIEIGSVEVPDTTEPLQISWSKGGVQSGWLYLGESAVDIEVYPLQFERLEDCSGKLDPNRWIKVQK